MTRRQLIGLSPFALAFAVLAAEPHVPFQATHVLGQGCYWAPRVSWATYGRAEPDASARRAEWACLQARGAKDPAPIPKIKVMLRRWPSEAELTAWRNEDAQDGDPLHAPDQTASVRAAAGR